MIRFEDYKDRFSYLRMERQDGILEVTIHRDGGQAAFDVEPGGFHDQFGEACYCIGRDPENKIMILTHMGDCLFDRIETKPQKVTAEYWNRMMREGKDLLLNLLDIDIPIIGTVRGNTFIHAELVILSDIVIAGEDTRLADKAHTNIGISPSDGVHVIWTELLGPNRGRHFLLMGAEIDAQEALRLGIVAEVVPNDQLLDRARAVARELAQKSRLTLQYARISTTLELKRRMMNDLGHGLALEGLSVLGLMNRE